MRISQVLASCSLDQTEAGILLASVLKKDRTFLHAYPEKQLTEGQNLKFVSLLKRRKNSEPLAYILGYKEFYGLKFLVSHDVLIPRAETEDLVEAALDKIKGLTRPVVADIGTGSGCIAISIAVNNPRTKIYATDISKKALEVARKNARLHGVTDQITFLEGNLLDPLKEDLDLIVANLPYIPEKRYHDLPTEIKEYEPKLALFSEQKPLSLYQILFSQAKKVLKPAGSIIYEVDGKVFTKEL
ncbi:MAG: protein-(glutamine-N5) methyltransferase, release factor-specific [Candidatus Woykebacteria bacterium RIFCSPHIGHO2_12_FULL_45_10]|uniref:peptide chain release factor N(5)-glutamine methyltransferase n=1 Tax=Candidatus Woykebacteria bacterium RIFCSPHIGHO2_12_FULL_45_10 TaxID=1802603 RepID=A0A1G1WPV8_9BACT|nr:MAG: protein-(glutamine-N5) methyltransferase, release factor-specific [Candidatus Woykebacteria bacterium RIFCSPHIGHO2_12_FULL_45_10]